MLMALSIIVVGGLAYLQYRRVDEARSRGTAVTNREFRDLPVIGDVPAFSLIDQTGRKVTLDDLKGKIWVADFIFTTCGGPCPIMTKRMRELHEAIYSRGLKNVITVSFTVDPETDTPEVLTEYSRQFKADSLDWLFLTGDTLSIYDLSTNGFKLHAAPGEGDHQVEHSPRFVLVDHRGRIRSYYEIVLDEEMDEPRAEVMDRPMPRASKEKLLADIHWLLREVKR